MLRLTVQPSASPRFYRFGPNVLDCLRGVLWQEGVEVPLTPRVLDILVTLVRHHGEVVTKDDFMRLVWQGAAVEDNNLARQISTLRKLLHERPDQREYIATVAGQGYRFVGTVTAFDELPDDLLPLVGRTRAATAAGDHGAPPTGVTTSVDANASAAPVAAVASAAAFGTSPAAATAEAPAAPPATIAQDGHASPRARNTVQTALLVGAAASLLILLATAWPDAPTNAAPVSRALWQVTYGPGAQVSSAWSPDGTKLALASDHDGNFDIWIHGLGDEEPRRLTDEPAHDWQPDWSPDGAWIAFRSERSGGGIYVVPAEGGRERRIAAFGSAPRWSPSGRHLLFTQAAPGATGAVKPFIAGLDHAPPRRVDHPALADLQIAAVAWAPDGRLSAWGRTGTRWRFVTVPIDAAGPVTESVVPEALQSDAAPVLGAFRWNPTGRFLYFEGRSDGIRNLWRVTVNPVTLAWTGVPERLTVGPGNDILPAPSPDGSRLAFSVDTSRPALWAFPFDAARGVLTADGEPLVAGEPGRSGADATSDGTRVLYRVQRADRQEIWLWHQTHGARPLVSRRGWNHSSPRLSHDDHLVAYQSSRRTIDAGTERRIVVLDLRDGTPRESVLVNLTGDQQIVPSDWSRDNGTILAACRPRAGASFGICTIAVDRPHQQRMLTARANVHLYQARYSPDQKWISFIGVPASDPSVSTIYIVPAEGGEWLALTDGTAYDDKPRWSPDGRVLYYVSNRDGRFEVWGRRFEPETGRIVGDAFRVTSFEGSRRILSPYLADMEMIVTADRLFLPMYEVSSRIWMLDQVDH